MKLKLDFTEAVNTLKQNNMLDDNISWAFVGVGMHYYLFSIYGDNLFVVPYNVFSASSKPKLEKTKKIAKDQIQEVKYKGLLKDKALIILKNGEKIKFTPYPYDNAWDYVRALFARLGFKL